MHDPKIGDIWKFEYHTQLEYFLIIGFRRGEVPIARSLFDINKIIETSIIDSPYMWSLYHRD